MLAAQTLLCIDMLYNDAQSVAGLSL